MEGSAWDSPSPPAPEVADIALEPAEDPDDVDIAEAGVFEDEAAEATAEDA